MTSIREFIAIAALLPLAAAPAAAEDVERGRELFQLCAACHGVDGAGDQVLQAPAIAGLDQWYVAAQLEKFKSGARGAHPDDLAGLRMRPMARTLRSKDDVNDLADVAAYVNSMAPTHPAPTLQGGDAARGQQIYQPCIACHGPDGGGNPQLGGPPLARMSDWYLFSQLEKFKTGVRGGGPGDTTGALMRPMAMILTDDQAMKDVIAHIMTLSN